MTTVSWFPGNRRRRSYIVVDLALLPLSLSFFLQTPAACVPSLLFFQSGWFARLDICKAHILVIFDCVVLAYIL